MNNFISYPQKKAFQDSMDWFKGKSTPETMVFTSKFSHHPIFPSSNGPFIDGLPIKNGWIFHGYVSHNQMVSHFYHHLYMNPLAPVSETHPAARSTQWTQ